MSGEVKQQDEQDEMKQQIATFKTERKILCKQKKQIVEKISIVNDKINACDRKLKKITLIEMLKNTENYGYYLVDPAVLFSVEEDEILDLFESLVNSSSSLSSNKAGVAIDIKEVVLVECIYRTQTTNVVGGRRDYVGNWEIVESENGNIKELKIVQAGTLKKEFDDESDFLENVIDEHFQDLHKIGDLVDTSDFDTDIDWFGAGDHKGFYGKSEIKKLAFIIKTNYDDDDD
jgi:hypothetical protein